MGRLIIAGAGAVVVIFLVIIGFGLLTGGGGNKTDYKNLAQQQAELIRVSDIGASKANQAEAKALAVTAKYSLTSQQSGILSLAKKSGVKTDAKSLALGKNSQTDALFTSAEQANQFDSVFTKALRANLKIYADLIKKIHDNTSSVSARNTLAKDYNDIIVLIGNQTSTQPQQ